MSALDQWTVTIERTGNWIWSWRWIAAPPIGLDLSREVNYARSRDGAIRAARKHIAREEELASTRESMLL